MKKYFLFLAIPFTVFAETCEELKTQAISNITSSEALLTDNFRYISITHQNITSLGYTLDTLDQRTSGDPYVNTARGQLNAIRQGVDLVFQNENTISNYLSTTRSLLSSIDCSCDETETCPCDFSEIIQLLTSISSATSDTHIELQRDGLILSQIDDTLSQIETKLDDSFGSVTNILIDMSYYLGNLSTNLFKIANNFYPLQASEKNTYLMLGNQLRPSLRDWASYARTQSAFTPKVYGTLSSMYSLLYVQFLELSSLNNYFYDYSYRAVPTISNTLVSIHRDQTNYFSFFRGEIGVHGVLEDWTNEEADGTYYDFLTNHYINVVRGGSLSGYTAEKTNWFARIETLLASLVFLDNSNSNAYDSVSSSVSNSFNRVKDDFNSRLDGVSSASSTQIELASDIERSMYESLKSFSKAFSSASLPSSVRVIYVYKGSGSSSSSSSDTVDVSVDVEGKLKDFIEIIRSCTTLCWVFFGLWFMFKFSVWTVKKIYILIRYIIDFFNMVAGGK